MKKSKIINPEQVSVDSLLSILDDSMLRGISKELNSDKWVIKLDTVTVFKLVLYSILDSDRLSLRVMSENYTSVPFQILEESVVGDRTAHSSLRDRLVKIDVRFFEKIYGRSRQRLLY